MEYLSGCLLLLPVKKKLLICPSLWILTRWHSRLSSKRALLQRLSRDMAPELILDLCSLLAGCPTAPWLNAIWHIFNRSITFFLYCWIYIEVTGVSREMLILLFYFSLFWFRLVAAGYLFVLLKEMQEELIHKLSGYTRANFISKTQKKIYYQMRNPWSKSLSRLDDQSCWFFSPNEAIVILIKDRRKKCNALKETIWKFHSGPFPHDPDSVPF